MSANNPPPDIPIATPADTTPLPVDAQRIQSGATHSYTGFHRQLQESFAQDFIQQSNRLDDTTKRLLTLQLAIPGIFAVLLKLLPEGQAQAVEATQLYRDIILIGSAFLSWTLALIFSLWALQPKKHTVNPQVLENKSQDKSFFGLIDFYQASAQHKHRHITISSLLTLLGLLLMVAQILLSGSTPTP